MFVAYHDQDDQPKSKFKILPSRRAFFEPSDQGELKRGHVKMSDKGKEILNPMKKRLYFEATVPSTYVSALQQNAYSGANAPCSPC